MRDRAFDSLRQLPVLETRPEHFLRVLESGTVCTNIFLRRVQNFALDMSWLPWPVLPRKRWPTIQFKDKRGITWEEQQKVLGGERNPELRDFYELLWHLGGSQTDMASLRAEDVDWTAQAISYSRMKTGTQAVIRFGKAVVKILERRPTTGCLFPQVVQWNLSHLPTEQDPNGVTLLYYYQNGLDPNDISFSILVASSYVNTSSPTVQLNIAKGFPSYYAVLVDNNNFASANWAGYTGPNLSVNLGSTQGPHNVWIGLRGLPADAQQTWQETTLVLDSTAPAISITSPPNSSSFNTTRVNVAGTFSENYLKQITVNGVPAYVNGNTFEAMNVPLAVGANTLTATLQNLSGSTATASISATGSASPVDPVQLQATPIAGFAPLNVSFQVSASVPGTIQQVLYDFNGDGVSDQTATDLNPISYSYSAAGQSFPVVTIVTTAGRFSSAGGWNSTDPNRLRINVQSPPVQQNVISIADPVDLKCDSAGNLYVLSRSTATITEYNSMGTIVRSLSGIGSAPRGLDVDGTGNVYVADTGDNQMLKFNPTTSSFQLNATFGAAGTIGKSDKSSGSGNGEFNAPFDVAVSPDGGTISVSDSGNNRIQQFATTDGTFIGAFGQQGNGDGQFNSPEGLTYDNTGYLYIVDSGNNRIAVAFSSSVIGTSGTSGTSLGQFQGAVNLGVGSRGIYVADTGNNRVQIFDPLATEGGMPTPFTVRSSVSTEMSLNQPNAVGAVADCNRKKFTLQIPATTG